MIIAVCDVCGKTYNNKSGLFIKAKNPIFCEANIELCEICIGSIDFDFDTIFKSRVIQLIRECGDVSIMWNDDGTKTNL